MEKYKEKYRINSNRMPGWDYAKGGKYYITICTCNRICCFGDVINGEMHLSAMGKIARQLWLEIPEHFADTWLDEFIVMPNHIHGIVVMKRMKQQNGRDRNKQPGHSEHSEHLERAERPERPEHPVCRDAINRVSTYQHEHQHNNPKPDFSKKQRGGITGIHNPMLSDDSLGKIIRWYKGRCTYEFNKMGCVWYEWQPRFHDKIIRNDKRLLQIRRYICNNPLNWDADENNLK